MDRVGLERFDPAAQFRPAAERQPDFGIAGTWPGREAVRRIGFDHMATLLQAADRRLERADDAVDLRTPRIADDRDPHAVATAWAAASALPAAFASSFSQVSARQSISDMAPL